MGQEGRVPAEFIDACAHGLVARVRTRLEEYERRAAVLRERAARTAFPLFERFGVTRIWLFGSLAWGGVHARSDVDLLVEGLPASDWLRAAAAAEDVIGAPVDLVRIEDAPSSLIERVRRDGVLLHGAR